MSDIDFEKFINSLESGENTISIIALTSLKQNYLLNAICKLLKVGYDTDLIDNGDRFLLI